VSEQQWRLRISHIIEGIEKIARYTQGLGYEEFIKQEMAVDAVVRNLEIIGEAARYVPAEIQRKYADIPWGEMQGTRNILIHEYFGVSLPIIWQTITEDLPPLVARLQSIIANTPKD
jgi:uncharacterized protein with HEPN domain